MKKVLAVVVAGLTACVGAESVVTSGPEHWAGIPAHPAVVNPVGGQDPAYVMSLRGKWLFREADCEKLRHPYSFDITIRTNRFGFANCGYDGGGPLPLRELGVPGVWEAQGVGATNRPSVPWVCNWDYNQMLLRNVHQGEGWYGKLVRLPESWRGRRIWIKLGGVRQQAWVWVNGGQVAWNDCFCGTYKYEITPFVKFGEEENYIAIQVTNNRTSRKGDSEEMHRWGGIHRDIELEATPSVFIDDVWVRGDFDHREAEVHVEIGGMSEGWEDGKVRVAVEGETIEQAIGRSNGQVVLRVPLRDFRPWSPEHPNLYWARVELLDDGKVTMVRKERFGVRKLEVRGNDFYLNGRPFFVRGFGQCYYYPLTGSSPADRTYHLKRLSLARKAGFNAVRLHTHCENPEYFEAADEAGILVQPELPYYNSTPCGGGEFDPERDVTELYRHFRRYPSFAFYSMGNEGTFGKNFDRYLHRLVKRMDPDRIKINQDTGRPELSEADVSDVVGGPVSVWPRGHLGRPDRPCVAHEYLNLCVKTDTRLANRFTGVIVTPLTRERRAAWLAKFGLTHDWGDRLQDAQHMLQRAYQKEGIEAARLDPECDGYHFWTISDVTVAVPVFDTFSAQGLFNIFWEPKIGGSTAESFARFNSSEVVLADIPVDARIRTSGERMSVDIYFANYGDRAYDHARLEWTLVRTADGQPLAVGHEDVGGVPLGPARKVGTVVLTVPGVERPVRAKLSVKLECAVNEWELWVFPHRSERKALRGVAAGSAKVLKALSALYEDVLPPERAGEANVIVAEYGSTAVDVARSRGQKVLAIGPAEGEPNVSLGWWNIGEQVGTVFADHPVLSGLPHGGCLSPLFRRIFKKGYELPIDGISEKDMIVVGEGGPSCHLYAAMTDGVLMIFGLDLFAPVPEARSLLDGMLVELLK